LVSWGDYMIIKFYVFLIFAFLKWYCFAINFFRVQKIVINFLRQSCLLTLALKHNKTKAWVCKLLSSNLHFNLLFKNSSLPSNQFLSRLSKKFLIHDGTLSNCNFEKIIESRSIFF
jgi:hypothetical protein